jgi:hypothetical protein
MLLAGTEGEVVKEVQVELVVEIDCHLGNGTWRRGFRFGDEQEYRYDVLGYCAYRSCFPFLYVSIYSSLGCRVAISDGE